MENSSRDRNTRPPDLLPEKSACRSRINRTEHGTMHRFKIRKEVRQGCILSPYLFTLHAEYIMRSTRLDEAQAAGENINNLKYADDTTLRAESEEN